VIRSCASERTSTIKTWPRRQQILEKSEETRSRRRPFAAWKSPNAPREIARQQRVERGEAGYTARHIEVLEGLERCADGRHVHRRHRREGCITCSPRVIDNAMDEALAGHATFIEVELEADGFVCVTDKARHPVDPHPKFKNKSALEVIMCTPAPRRQIRFRVYETSGGCTAFGSRSPMPVRPHGGRGRTRPEALQNGVRARQAKGKCRTR
jgi:hypothetical protein